MIMIGCTPEGRYTEQHDIFFGIAENISDLKQDLIDFWPEAKGKIHVDAWRKITVVDDYEITIISKNSGIEKEQHLFFLNLGGYKEGEFEEYHYKKLAIATKQSEAIKKAKKTTFYKHYGFKGAESHIDDKYGIDVDDVYKVEDILHPKFKEKYSISITETTSTKEDKLHIGYLKLSAL
ncbi:protein of unknown function [Pustulibacterium marinum]|uniref:DUF1543 domain-containing protein n=2 Tax=Pustulibacterium marinum TaxID=1224947 RepID=A0A1I7FCL2_9FLAO|nr:protein of unknown function [Pustulibacterium marinum]